MPKLNEQTQIAKKLQAIDALQLIARGFDKQEACTEAGISVWQFDHWIAEGGPIIEKFQRNIVEAERIRLVDIANAQGILLQQLIESVTRKGVEQTVFDENGNKKTVTIFQTVDPLVQLKVIQYLDKLREKLEARHGVHTETDTADEYLAGPRTQIETSKMLQEHELSRSSVKVSQTDRGDVEVGITFKNLIEDVTPTDNDPTD